MILNLIFGLFITILLTIIYVIASVLGCNPSNESSMFGKKSGGYRGNSNYRGYGNNYRSNNITGGGDMNSALDFMGGILGGDDSMPPTIPPTIPPTNTTTNIAPSTIGSDEITRWDFDSADITGISGGAIARDFSDHSHNSHHYQKYDPSSPPDFPIDDPDLKAAYTAAFVEVYGTKEKPPVVTYSDIKGSLKYTEEEKIYTAAYHIGQRKLILNEIQFLTRIPTDELSLVVYAGAAPSHKGAMLASLFPNLKLLLIDPAPFEIRPYRNVVVTALNVTDETDPAETIDRAFDAFKTADICTARILMSGGIAEELGRRFGVVGSSNNKTGGKKEVTQKISFSRLYFVSDIRTNIDEEGPSTFDIVWNSAQHVEWVTKMAPTESMLKFRTPFFNESDIELQAFEEMSTKPPFSFAFDATSQIHNYRDFQSRSFTFFDGEIFIQPWAPISSTETRLVFQGVPTMRKYNASEYEDRFFYYNKILRNFQLYKNPNADRKLGFDHCADCALENQIWTDYCKSRGVTDISSEVHHYVKTLSDLTYRPLIHDNHGRAFGPIPIGVLMHKFANYQPKLKKKFVRRGARADNETITHSEFDTTDDSE
jgi:hypothetical protein